MNPLKKLAGQTVIYGLSSVVGRLLNYLLVPLYTRYFLPEEYGVVTEMYAYVAFLVVFLTYGIETAFFRYSHKFSNKKIVYSTSLISLLITSTVFIVIIYISAQPIANWLQYPDMPEYVKYFALIIGLDAISSISFAKLRESNKATRFALIRLVNIFVNIGLNLFFIIYCPYALEKGLSSVEFINSVYSEEIGVGYIFIANLIASIVTFLMLLPQMIKSVWIFDKILWKNMMIYALPLLIAGLAGMTNETIDRVLLKHLLPPNVNASSELGLYGAFYKLSILMILFIQTFRFAAEPFFFAQEKDKNSKKIYADVMKYFVIITSFIFLVVTMFYEYIVLFLGNNYHDPRGFKVVSILLAANLFLGIYYNLSIWYKLSEKTKYGAYLSIFGAVITLILNFILIPIIGFEGSAWATLACYFSMTVASYFLGKRHFIVPYQLQRILFYLGIALFPILLPKILNLLPEIIVYFEFSLLGFDEFLSKIIGTIHSVAFSVIYIIIFICITFYLEKPKKFVISNPELFD